MRTFTSSAYGLTIEVTYPEQNGFEVYGVSLSYDDLLCPRVEASGDIMAITRNHLDSLDVLVGGLSMKVNGVDVGDMRFTGAQPPLYTGNNRPRYKGVAHMDLKISFVLIKAD